MPPQGERAETERFQVMIDGETFVIRGTASAEHVRELARLVDERIEEVRRTQPNLPRHRVAILVALNLADELVTARKENEELLELLEETK